MSEKIPADVTEELAAGLTDGDRPTQDVWAIVELMGHVRLAGRLTEEEKFGGKLGRLDIPEGDGFITQFFGASSVYRITIVTEQVARHTTKQTTPAPVSPWDYPKQLTAGKLPVNDPYADREYEDRGDDGSDLEP